MDRNGEVQAASAFSNNTSSSVFYCWTHGPGMAFDLHETTSPLTFAAFATIAAPIAFLLNTLTILAVKQKKELRQRLSSVLLSSMAVVHLLTGGICIPLSAIVALLLPYRIVAVQHFDELGNFNPDVQPGNLLAYPSDNDCVGAVHIHSKMD